MTEKSNSRCQIQKESQSAMWELTAERLQCCVVPHHHHVFLSLCLCPLRLSSSPSFFCPSLVISQGPGMGTARREVPTRLTLPACLSPFPLFFPLEVEHHRGVRFSAINCCLILIRQRAHTCPLDLERTHECVITRICQTYVCMQVITITFMACTPLLICTNSSEQKSNCPLLFLCEQLKWTHGMCAPESVSFFIYSLLIKAC